MYSMIKTAFLIMAQKDGDRNRAESHGHLIEGNKGKCYARNNP